jgi:hypothetical protein
MHASVKLIFVFHLWSTDGCCDRRVFCNIQIQIVPTTTVYYFWFNDFISDFLICLTFSFVYISTNSIAIYPIIPDDET